MHLSYSDVTLFIMLTSLELDFRKCQFHPITERLYILTLHLKKRILIIIREDKLLKRQINCVLHNLL